MAIEITRDADNKWYTYIDWNPWIDKQAEISPNGPGLTITINSAAWSIPSDLVEEAETEIVGNITFFTGSSGSNGTLYPLGCTITYSIAELTPGTGFTQTRTINIRLQNQ